MKNFYSRYTSLLTGCEMETLHTFKNFPIHMLSENEPEEDSYCDMVFEIGKEDGFVQLQKVVYPSILYKDTHSNAIGKTWREVHDFFAKLLIEIGVSGKVLEIGGGTGICNAMFNIGGEKNTDWTIVEPCPRPIEGCKAKYIKGFFPDAINCLEVKYDYCIHTYFMEHVENLKVFLCDIKNVLKVGGEMVFAVPNIKSMFEKKILCVMNFEHTFWISERYLDYILNTCGFEIKQKYLYEQNCSIIYQVINTEDSNKKELILLNDMYKQNKQIFMSWIQVYENLADKLNKRIEKEKNKIYVFGAHISTQFLIAFGLNMEKIEAILDNDSYKWDKRVCGTNKKIMSPKYLSRERKVIVIIPNSPYAKEIKEDIVENINNKVEFWEN